MVEWRIQWLETTASTNDNAKLVAAQGEAEGLVIHALQQTAGRGRQGRVWESPIGNLYCSVLLRPHIMPTESGYFSFIAALALADTVKAFVPQAEVKLKWPNDVLVAGCKISGILLEAGEDWLVVGMGLNIVQQPENALYPTTSLAAQGISPMLDEVLNMLLKHLNNWYAVFTEQGFAAIRTSWLRQAQTGPMTVKLPQGELKGDFVDLDTDGQLRLRLADGSERSIATGDVFMNVKD